VATKGLLKGSAVMKTPSALHMCPQSFLKSELGKALLSDDALAKTVTLDEPGLLTVLLLGELSKGEDSFWGPYLATLPKDLGDAVSVTMTPEYTDQLNGTIAGPYLRDAIEVLQKMVVRQEDFFADSRYAPLVKKHYPNIDTSKAKLQYAVGMVQSRQTQVPTEPKDPNGGKRRGHGCLVPMHDLMNHRPNALIGDLLSEGIYAQELAQDQAKDSEIYTNYGMQNIELSFNNYGFSSPEMGINLGPQFREFFQQSLEDPAMMEHGDEHAELVGKQMLNKKCHGFDNAAMGGVIGWKLLKRVLQCTRIMMASPAGLEMMVRREIEEPRISHRPFDFGGEVKALELWVNFFAEQKVKYSEWSMSPVAKKPVADLNAHERFVVNMHKAERLFVAGHLKELTRLYEASPELADAIEEDDKDWEEAQADKATFRLTDNVAEKAAARAAEEARVQEVLKGAFDAKAIGGSGSVFDEF